MRTICVLWLLLLVQVAQAEDKTPPPDADSLHKATALIRELYKEKYEAASTTEQKQALAAELLKKAKTVQNDATTRYALLKDAGRYSVKAGDMKLALQIVEEMDRTFQIDVAKMKLAVVDAIQATWKQGTPTGGNAAQSGMEKPAVAKAKRVFPLRSVEVTIAKNRGSITTDTREAPPAQPQEGEAVERPFLGEASVFQLSDGRCRVLHDFSKVKDVDRFAGNSRSPRNGKLPVRIEGGMMIFNDAEPKANFFPSFWYPRFPCAPARFRVVFDEIPGRQDFPAVMHLSVMALPNVGKSTPNAAVLISSGEAQTQTTLHVQVINFIGGDVTLVEYEQQAETVITKPFKANFETHSVLFECSPPRNTSLGIRSMEITSQFRGQLGINFDDKNWLPIVGKIFDGSPAGKAGILAGDEILAVDGKRVDSKADAVQKMRVLKFGDTVEVLVRRGDKTQKFQLSPE